MRKTTKADISPPTAGLSVTGAPADAPADDVPAAAEEEVFAPVDAPDPVSGLTPTSNPPRNAYGLELDRFGLPVNGPARAAVLAGMDVADPALEPGDWDFRGAKRAAEVMENIYG